MREQSLFSHWIWLEMGKPQQGIVYNIMKRTRHRYHYAVRCCKKEKQVIQKTKLANNIGNSKDFWQEIKKINPNARLTSSTIDEANGASEISKLFFNKYRSLYNGVYRPILVMTRSVHCVT